MTIAGSRLTSCLIIAAGFGIAAALAWPGQIEFDSLKQLLEGRTGLYSNWHPPIMSWLLGVGDSVVPGTGSFMLLDMALGFGALLGVVLLNPGSWRMTTAALVCVLLPQLMVYQGIIWKDVLFADACTAGFVCLALSLRRRGWLIAAAVLVGLAALTRQNGALVVPLAALTLGLMRGRVKPALLFFAGVTVGALLVHGALQLRASKAGGVAQEIMDLQLYDLAGMKQRLPDLGFDILERDAPAIARAMPAAVPLYTPATHDPIADNLTQLRLDGLQALGPIARQWRATILAHPLDYLAMRADVFAWLVTTRRPDIYPVYTVGVDGPPALLKAAGLSPRMNARDTALDGYGAHFVGTPVFSHLFWMAVDVLCLVLLLCRRAPADLAFAGLLATALVYAASYFVIAIDCEYRYLYVVDLAGIVAAFHLLTSRRLTMTAAPG